MDNVHYTVFGAIVEYEKEGRTVQQIEYQAWPPERRMTWHQEARNQSGESREKALEELALQVCNEAIFRQGTREEQSLTDHFLITFSYEPPYESGISCWGMEISTATKITPFRLKAQEQSYFQNKFWERYQEMLKPKQVVFIGAVEGGAEAERPEEEVSAGEPAVVPLLRE